MFGESLEQKLQRVGDPVQMLRNAQIGGFAFPMKAQFSNWRDEQEAWQNTAVLFDQSFHMTDIYFKGSQVKKFFSEIAVNSFATFGRNKAKQFVGVNEDGLFVGDAILFGLEDDEYSLVGTGIAGMWAAYQAEISGYDIEVTRDPATIINPNPRKIFRFQIQGPNALKIVQKAAEPFAPVKFFNMGDLTIAGVPARALNHTMVGHPGLEHTGLEIIGPRERGPEVWAALVAAGGDFGIREGGGLAYPTTALETGWIPFPVPAIYTGEEMKPYREWLSADSFEANYAIAGSYSPAKIEDYYLTPWDLGYGRLVKFDHDFLGRSALEKLAEQPHKKKVWLRWNDEDAGRTLVTSLFGGKERTKYMEQPFTEYGVSQNDKVLLDGRQIGVSTYCSYTVNIGGFASIAMIDEADARDGVEVTLVWGEEDGGTTKPTVERHVQTEMRATISTQPLT
jgi:vanillate/3-O-methylgallate O-demethylase